MSRRIRIPEIGALGILILSSPGLALADDGCVALNGACATDTITADPDEALDDPVGTVTDTLEGAEDTTEPVVDPVLDAIDDLLGGGGIVEPPVGDGPDGHHGGSGQTVSGREGTAGGPAPGATGPTALVREAVSPPETIIGSAASGTRPPIAPHGAPGRSDGIIEGAVRGLFLVLFLFGVTLCFVLLQDRLDRNDPKLALAPLRAEVVTFE